MTNAFFLVGPTAVGKSSVAQWIAEAKGYDILSADSMLVYEGMDIGTAKPTREDRDRVRYHGLDITAPDKYFSVWDYYSYARRVFADNVRSGRKIIVVGGSGLYIRSLTDGLDETAPSAHKKRAYWMKVLEDDGVERLQGMLKKKSPKLYEALDDKQNGRRLIRALEKAEAGVENPVKTWDKEDKCNKKDIIPLVGLMSSRDNLNSRIELRVKEMYRLGLIEEVKKLLEKYGNLSTTAGQAIGYAEAIGFINGKCTRDEAVARTVIRTRQFAKRQRTWFMNQAKVDWVDIEDNLKTEELAERVVDCWEKHGPVKVKL